ncbi:MAG: hypothetical protein AUJ52_04435 [Elusimicrobia bacterium CG1_02_63_36]|nr:MAG: hypothetical protein AUJ52_04435 [Elusimicrobia bacterium CG1_02_63_36]PIP83357.1 MAG: iron ABC transporter [Elusimicrobia bacterium CG22_combo_CG10-13_8_21_14_all_63_91]PJA14850.1 MAG: DUF3341 domain-containing protein [Elusimicrobia bacterium CG_4_10_14_0_2_um_filter_63_34]PJB23096.1 MAG: DUF3341 domain-containing protein [Elusimicrobia bacterium CG_4_9_14_3_um_filter_62_55]
MADRDFLVGVFVCEQDLLAATHAAREAGFKIHDAYTPYPVHGMDEAMALPKTLLPRLCFLFGAAGLLLAVLFQCWVGLIDWPMNIGGKSFGARPALIPIAFELTVLFAGLGTVISFLVLRRLFPGREPECAGLGASDASFVLAFATPETEQLRGTLNRLLLERGAKSVREASSR